jgi:hypothetical protein
MPNVRMLSRVGADALASRLSRETTPDSCSSKMGGLCFIALQVSRVLTGFQVERPDFAVQRGSRNPQFFRH